MLGELTALSSSRPPASTSSQQPAARSSFQQTMAPRRFNGERPPLLRHPRFLTYPSSHPSYHPPELWTAAAHFGPMHLRTIHPRFLPSRDNPLCSSSSIEYIRLFERPRRSPVIFPPRMTPRSSPCMSESVAEHKSPAWPCAPCA